MQMQKFTILLGFIVFYSTNLYAQDIFFDDLGDVPKMQNMQYIDEGLIVFDSPFGRFIELFVLSKDDSQKIIDYYQSSLPELGWQQQTTTQFQRYNELLVIDFFKATNQPSHIIVRFTLSPQ